MSNFLINYKSDNVCYVYFLKNMWKLCGFSYFNIFIATPSKSKFE